MRSGVVHHAVRVDETNAHLLNGFDFAFVCVDRRSVRKVILEFLRRLPKGNSNSRLYCKMILQLNPYIEGTPLGPIIRCAFRNQE